MVVFFYCRYFWPGQRSSFGDHRCVTHLYCIPMWGFNCEAGRTEHKMCKANEVATHK